LLLALVWWLQPLWQRLGGKRHAAVLAGIAGINAWVFFGGAPLGGEQTGFGVLTVSELRDHDRYWRSLGGYVRGHYHPGELALLVPPSFTDGLRMAQHVLPEYWPATGLAVDPIRLRNTPPALRPGYFRYVTPDEARRDGRPTLCAARLPEQSRHYRKLFGDAYREIAIGSGMRTGIVAFHSGRSGVQAFGRSDSGRTVDPAAGSPEAPSGRS
jgi:hypothetical protein